MDYLLTRFLDQTLWNQILLGALAVLLIVFLGMILLQLVAYTLTVMGTKANVSRATGLWEIFLGVGLLALGVGSVVVQDYLHNILGTTTFVVSLGVLATGLFALAEGIGVIVWRRSGSGVVLLIWAIIGGIVWLLV